MKVCLDFRGHLEVEITADPEDDEAWTDALAKAWADASPEDVFEAAEVLDHEIIPTEPTRWRPAPE